MSYLEDPRVYFAAERTLLAWIRTGITTTGLGVVVAKFGLFLQYLAPPGVTSHKPGVSLVFGLIMVLIGTLTCLGAAIQFRGFVKTLSAAELPPRWFPSFAAVMAYAMALTGLGMGMYLIL